MSFRILCVRIIGVFKWEFDRKIWRDHELARSKYFLNNRISNHIAITVKSNGFDSYAVTTIINALSDITDFTEFEAI